MLCSEVGTTWIYQEDVAYLTSIDINYSNLVYILTSWALDSVSYMSSEITMETFHPYVLSAKY